jgi:hypothetical protein
VTATTTDAPHISLASRTRLHRNASIPDKQYGQTSMAAPSCYRPGLPFTYGRETVGGRPHRAMSDTETALDDQLVACPCLAKEAICQVRIRMK